MVLKSNGYDFNVIETRGAPVHLESVSGVTVVLQWWCRGVTAVF
jgi:hypothetical protein